MSEVCVETTAEIAQELKGSVSTECSGDAVEGVQIVSISTQPGDPDIVINPPSSCDDVGASGDDHHEKQTITKPENKILSAPVLRVERIKDEFLSEDDTGSEGPIGNLSQAEVSDQDHSGKESRGSDDFLIPDEEISNKIITQVEFYFSDINILKDAFLLKHVRRNKQGYVSIKLITSFKKVKSLSRDYRVVAHCLKGSSKLQVNEEGTKVRRVDALPDFDETTPSRTIVAVNLPIENPTIENIAEIFKDCGEIALIRILRPGKTIPGDIKKYCNKHPEIGTSTCGVVEFENHESALKACELGKPEDWRNGLRVVILSSRKKEKSIKDKKDKQKEKEQLKKEKANDTCEKRERNEVVVMLETEDGTTEADGDTSPKIESSPLLDKKTAEGGSKKRNKKNKRHSLVSDGGASSGSEMDQSNSPSDRDMNWRSSLSPGRCIDKSKLSPASTPGSSPRNSPRSSPRTKRRNIPAKSSPLAEGLSPRQSPKPSPMSSPESMRKNRESLSDREASPSGSPWVQRRLKAAQEMSPLAADGSPVASPLLGRRNLTSEGLIRQPKGPDGTKGFHGGAGRGKPVAVAED
ncbi:la-related protein 6-like [Lineus longissimus]|uniref:la-related protein 6-like n=1 Tax=Lineus longissimus TaxID=88925 RepID=UPI00315C8C29